MHLHMSLALSASKLNLGNLEFLKPSCLKCSVLQTNSNLRLGLFWAIKGPYLFFHKPLAWPTVIPCATKPTSNKRDFVGNNVLSEPGFVCPVVCFSHLAALAMAWFVCPKLLWYLEVPDNHILALFLVSVMTNVMINFRLSFKKSYIWSCVVNDYRVTS